MPPIQIILLFLPVLIQLIQWYINRKHPVPARQKHFIAHILTRLNEEEPNMTVDEKSVWHDRIQEFRTLAQEAGIEPE